MEQRKPHVPNKWHRLHWCNRNPKGTSNTCLCPLCSTTAPKQFLGMWLSNGTRFLLDDARARPFFLQVNGKHEYNSVDLKRHTTHSWKNTKQIILGQIHLKTITKHPPLLLIAIGSSSPSFHAVFGSSMLSMTEQGMTYSVTLAMRSLANSNPESASHT